VAGSARALVSLVAGDLRRHGLRQTDAAACRPRQCCAVRCSSRKQDSNRWSPGAESITKLSRVLREDEDCPRNSLRICGGLCDPGSGCRMFLVCRGRCRIEFPVAHLDPPRADMTLHRDADMVWAIAGTCSVKFLSGFAGGQGKNALAQA
jgi:hypothetical protein